ncbi:MAG: hypothetical protein J7551_06480, partial [Chloroflexi bacterium]|nr:hypothetical protein [Chloroflexota bacterium]
MAERPMFDDEELPEWLVAGGITFAGRVRSAADADVPPWARPQPQIAMPEFKPPADDVPPPWLAATEPVELPAFEQPAESVPPAFQAELPDSGAVSSEGAEFAALENITIAWDELPAAQSAPSDDPFADLDWRQETPAAAQTDQPAKPIFQTSWLSEALQPQQDSPAQAAPTFQTDWLKEIGAAESPAPSQQAASADAI